MENINLSKSQINKVGKEIRNDLKNNNKVSEINLEKLQEYRISHQKALSSTFDFLVKKSKHHYKGSLVVYRLKRIDTIIRKIGRYNTMAMSTMQDIAGCRAIVPTNNQIYKIVKEFQKSEDYVVVSEDNYIKNPRDTGYSSYHLIVRPVSGERLVEIQLRTHEQHYWATLVEITDLLYGIKLKEGQDHPELYMFHKLLAKSRNGLTTDEKAQLVEVEKKNGLIVKMITLFKANSYTAILRWIEALPNRKNPYLIMELDLELTPNFSFFDSFETAENEYFQKFTQEEPNMVLIHINKPDFQKLGLAYSNYVLTSHPSVKDYIEILQELLIEFKSGSKQKLFREYKKYYESIIGRIKLIFAEEFNHRAMNIEANETVSTQHLKALIDWRDSLIQRLRHIKESDDNLNKKLASIKMDRSNPVFNFILGPSED